MLKHSQALLFLVLLVTLDLIVGSNILSDGVRWYLRVLYS